MRLRSLTLLAAFFAATLPMLANTTYKYTGKAFDTYNGTYSSSNSVTGTLTVDSSPNPFAAPVAYSFSDGFQTLTNLNSTGTFGDFTVDLSGNILTWYISASRPGSSDFTVATSSYALFTGDTGNMLGSGTGGHYNDPGTWVILSSGTPEPSSVMLLGTGVFALAGVVRRRISRA